MVASDKIEVAKNCFNDIKKSGKNNFQKFKYFETKDIFPLVRKICSDLKLKTNIRPDIETNCFILTITDQEDNSTEQFFVPYAPLGAGDAGKFMQDFGRCQTYAMRYLYIQAFEIAVPDEIDNRDQKKQVKPKPQPKKKPVKTNVTKTIVQPIIEPKDEEVTDHDVKEMLNKVYDIIVTDGGKEFTEAAALWQLKRICKSEDLFNACKEALKMYTADTIEE